MTSPTAFLKERLAAAPDREVLVWRDRPFTGGWLLDRLAQWRRQLDAAGVSPGAVTALEAEFSPDAVALFLALAEARAILVPLTAAAAPKRDEFLDTAEAEWVIRPDPDGTGQAEFRRLPREAAHELYGRLRAAARPGLLLFSSGSTGRSKAALHDLARLLARFETPRRAYRGIAFLLFDHIGGINTMLHALANGGCLILPPGPDPDQVLEQVARHHADLLPVSPTFLNLILLSEAWNRHDLGSLKVVSYGTEPMPESTLRRWHGLFPAIRLAQTYGLSETGILPVKSKSSDSLWIRAGGDGCEVRVVDGMLQVRADTAMLGYLNAPAPFTPDGWFVTGDAVETDGEFIRILGRRSEIINVGGEKVWPAEVESVLQELENVAEVVVYGEPNPITGAMVCARVRLRQPEERASFLRRMREYCAGRLQRYKVPVRVQLTGDPLHGGRFKKIRAIPADTPGGADRKQA